MIGGYSYAHLLTPHRLYDLRPVEPSPPLSARAFSKMSTNSRYDRAISYIAASAVVIVSEKLSQTVTFDHLMMSLYSGPRSSLKQWLRFHRGVPVTFSVASLQDLEPD